MRKGPLMLGAGAAVLVFAISRNAAAASTASTKKPVSRRVAGSKLVPFTQEKVFWRYNKKKKKDEYRTQIAEDLNDLAAAASTKLGKKVNPNDFLLATLIASEAGNQSPTAKAAIAHAAITMAKRLKVPLRNLLLPPKQGGKLGSQHGRYASTARPPTAADLEIAEGVRWNEIPNPTPGAVQWDSPRAQNKLIQEGADGYEMDSDQLAARRESENKIAIYVADVDPTELRLWKPAA